MASASADFAEPLPGFEGSPSGVSIAGCRLVRLLEDGGTARSYLGRYLESSTVIVKLFDSSLTGDEPEGHDLYRWECEALLGLRHLALPQNVLFGRSEELGCSYLVQELVPGVRIASLRRALGRPFTPAEAADLLLPIADALVLCHRQGITHGHLTALHVLLEHRAPVPRARLVGLRPRLTSDVTDSQDTRALAILAYAMTVTPDADVASLPEILAGVPGVRASANERWNRVLLQGLRTCDDERMLQFRDGLADVLLNEPCVHRESAVLSDALPPLDAALEDTMTRPVRLPAVPRTLEDDDTGPTTLWVSPDAPLDDEDVAWAEHDAPGSTPMPPADSRIRPLYDPTTDPHDAYLRPDEVPTRPHLHVAPPPEDDVSVPLERTAGPEPSAPQKSMSETQRLDPAVLERLQSVPEPPRTGTPAPGRPRPSVHATDPGALARTPLSSEERSSMVVWMGAFVVGLLGAATAVLIFS